MPQLSYKIIHSVPKYFYFPFFPRLSIIACGITLLIYQTHINTTSHVSHSLCIIRARQSAELNEPKDIR